MNNYSLIQNKIFSGKEITTEEWQLTTNYIQSQNTSATYETMKTLRSVDGLNSYSELAEMISASKGNTVLEIGCAEGNLYNYLDSSFEYTGIDKSESEIQLAKEKYGETAHFFDQPLEKLDCGDQSFDVVTSHMVLHIIADLQSIMKKSYDLLKDEGRVIAVMRSAKSMDPILLHFKDLVQKFIQEKYPDFKLLIPMNTYSHDSLRAICRDIGFKDINIITKEFTDVYDSDRLATLFMSLFPACLLDENSQSKLRSKIVFDFLDLYSNHISIKFSFDYITVVK